MLELRVLTPKAADPPLYAGTAETARDEKPGE